MGKRWSFSFKISLHSPRGCVDDSIPSERSHSIEKNRHKHTITKLYKCVETKDHDNLEDKREGHDLNLGNSLSNDSGNDNKAATWRISRS